MVLEILRVLSFIKQCQSLNLIFSGHIKHGLKSLNKKKEENAMKRTSTTEFCGKYISLWGKSTIVEKLNKTFI